MKTKSLHLMFYTALLIIAAFLFVLPATFAQDAPPDAPPAVTQEADTGGVDEGTGNTSGEVEEAPLTTILGYVMAILVTLFLIVKDAILTYVREFKQRAAQTEGIADDIIADVVERVLQRLGAKLTPPDTDPPPGTFRG